MPLIVVVVIFAAMLWAFIVWGQGVERDWQEYLRSGVPPKKYFTRDELTEFASRDIDLWRTEAKH